MISNKLTDENKLSISKQRLAEYGEYFTPENIVDDMLKMVDGQLERLDSRFLEPACGTGNFLVPILTRKLLIAKKKYKKVQFEYEQKSILALSSLYGIELLSENVVICRERLFSIWEREYRHVCKDNCNEDTVHTAKFIVECNIVNGDALTMKTSNGTPIVFSEWAFVKPRLLQRTEYTFSSLSDYLSSEPSVQLKKYIKDYRRIWNSVDGV